MCPCPHCPHSVTAIEDSKPLTLHVPIQKSPQPRQEKIWPCDLNEMVLNSPGVFGEAWVLEPNSQTLSEPGLA